MTDRYVGIGGNDGNDGLSWAQRKLTLNGAEDTPVVAGDTVYVGPGTYRELLTIDVIGTSGAVITYIADVSGENTDSVGGIVRVTGSDDDQSATRANCIIATTGEDYRTFRGFRFDIVTTTIIDVTDVDNWIIEDCYLEGSDAEGIEVNSTSTNMTIRRCVFDQIDTFCIEFNHSTEVDDAGHLVENCMYSGSGEFLRVARIGGITLKNSTISANTCLRVATSPNAGQTITVNNCIFIDSATGLRGVVTGFVIEDYNTFYIVATARNNVDTGVNSITFPPLFLFSPLLDGFILPRQYHSLNEWSQITRIAGTGEATDDLFGIIRPTTSAKKSWGAMQLREAERETGTVQTGSAALTLADAGDHQIYVPVTATSTTFEVAARYESEYAGTLPRLIVRQPGQADQVDTMVAAADTWETLSLTFTPNAIPPYVIIILRSLNTSVTGDFDTYWDDLDVS